MTAGLRSNLIWSGVRNWSTRLGSVAVFLIVARIVDTQQLGLFSATIAIIAIAELFAENGLGDAVVQSAEIDDNVLTAVLLINIAAGFLLALGLIASAPTLEHYFAAPGLSPFLTVALMSLLLNSASYVPQSVLRRHLQFKWLGTRALIATAISGVTGIILAFSGFGTWSLVAQVVLAALINFVLVWIKIPFNPISRPNFRGALALVKFSAPVLLGRMLYFLCMRAVELVLLQRFGPTVLSLYIIGSRLYFVNTQLLTQVLVDVAFSSLSRLVNDRPALEENFFAMLRIATTITTPIFLGLVAIAPELCVTVFGSKGHDAAPFLEFVALFGTFQVAQFFFGSALSAIGKPSIPMMVLGFQATMSAVILFPSWHLQPTALVAANSATLVLIWPVYLAACSRYCQFSVVRILKITAAPYAAGALMLLAVYFSRGELMRALPSPLLRGTALVAIGAAVFIGSLAIFAPSLAPSVLKFRRPNRAEPITSSADAPSPVTPPPVVPPPVQSASGPPRFVLLDAARSLAALAVVCWHWQNFYGPSQPGSTLADFAAGQAPFYAILRPFYAAGWFAVDYFFMLSGFVMCLVYQGKVRDGHVSARTFGWLRFSRLYPLHLVTLLIIVAFQLGWWLAHGDLVPFPAGRQVLFDAYHFMLQLPFASQWGLQRGPSFNDPIWSVSIEVLLYAAFFVAVRCTRFSVPIAALIAGAGYILFATNLVNGLGRGLFCFFIGCILYRGFLAWRQSPRPDLWRRLTYAWLVFGILTAIVCFSISLPATVANWVAHTLGQAVPTLRHLEPKIVERTDRALAYNLIVIGVYPALLMTLVFIEQKYRRLASPLAALGNISYSSYLIHFPLQMLCAMLFGSAFMAAPGLQGEVAFVVFLVVLLILSFASYRFLEVPAQRWLRGLASAVRRPSDIAAMAQPR
jgi:peptidoglycan/LPS O-acetylase OafA/YrhL/O-antigen/teichoic acid export membrane protein